MVYSVALTGNIASGKSTAAKIFADLGIDVINADKVSKELSAKNTPSYKAMVQHFGDRVLLDNGEINRRYLRDLIFSNAKERLWLENLLHPLIREQLLQQINGCTSPYCIIEIPLNIDKVHYPYLNKILLITAPIETQIQRVIERDHCTKEQAMAILSAQPDISLRLKNADDLVCNDAGIHELTHEIEKLHTQYLKDSKIKVL